MFPFGSIVLARFPFTYLSGDKRRRALVISRDNDRRTDLVVFSSARLCLLLNFGKPRLEIKRIILDL